ncbi:hypothetical protein GPOL_c25010 [Gordonia polyisoprenivorans VH2]|uniref:Uncharacterized protein n=1 Tax=Gordonia polyisoprenivorans (strain DSM 44266 / VH2) TaxID=1112204 RepID=H6N3Q9_GORPV|nr:hypothetical protein [Gordonia polyisoprenivorans]AFA73530.1 hypothetical protein GPOL_c25010 [Gordonia polyisoprenivorans VH2]
MYIPPTTLAVNGLTELAFGVLTGWVYGATKATPETIRSLGVRAPDRIRQWHLELMMQGAFTVACNLAVPNAPRLVTTALAVGAWSSPSAFLPLAFKPELEDSSAFRAATVAANLATTVGYVGMVVTAYKRHRAHHEAAIGT